MVEHRGHVASDHHQHCQPATNRLYVKCKDDEEPRDGQCKFSSLLIRIFCWKAHTHTQGQEEKNKCSKLGDVQMEQLLPQSSFSHLTKIEVIEMETKANLPLSSPQASPVLSEETYFHCRNYH